MKHLPSQSLLSGSFAKLKLVALACGMFLFMGTSAYGQRTTSCAVNPVAVAKAYIGYQGLTNETAAMYSWCQNETLANIQSYCNTLSNAVAAVANFDTLSDACKVKYLSRKQELDVIRKLSQARH
jgi:hypothetical protein